MRTRLLPLLVPLVVAMALLAAPQARAQTSACYDYLNKDPYTTSFSAADFDSSSSVDIVNGDLVLSVDRRALEDPNRISINTRQRLSANYVYESAGANHTFGWFIWDNAVTQFMTASGYNYTSQTCSTDGDCDPGLTCQWSGTQRVCAYQKWVLKDEGAGNGYLDAKTCGNSHNGNNAFDWFEALYLKPSCNKNNNIPYLLQWARDDGGTYPHISNFLEKLVAQQGQWVFLLADDDTDYGYGDAPVKDIRATKDGIPDYDVNGDGVIDANDRTVDMGTFDAGTELVFFLNVYYPQVTRMAGMGMETGGLYSTDTTKSGIIPYFSKRVLNPDYVQTGTDWRDRDIGCGYPATCGLGLQGWLDQASIDRLRNLYGLSLLPEKKRIMVRQDGQAEHVFIGAPSSDPSWWLLGFEDLYQHPDNHVDYDYNDLVFLIFRVNGGETVSKVVSDDLTPTQKANSTITKVYFKKQEEFPPPCSSDRDLVRIEYYVSISVDANNKPIWVLVDFPPGQDEVTIDMQALGQAGTELRWKAVIISNDQACQPKILDVNIGYEAMEHGDYLFSSPVLLANSVFKGSSETRDQSWTVTGGDYSNRGHFTMYEVYEPDVPTVEVNRKIWDAGQLLSSRNPDDRKLWTNHGGSLELVNSSASAWLLNEILSSTDRAEKLNGVPVFDTNGDKVADDTDAKNFIEWTRGWEDQSNGVQRAWKLGAVNTSSAAIVHPPGEPEWMSKTGVPTDIRTAYTSWADATARSERGTVAYVGSQSGMLHAFRAGSYRWGDNPDTSTVEQRGYYKYVNGAPDYGDGRELWAFVPPSLLENLKYNKVRDYYPELNPPAMVDGAVVVSDVYGKFPYAPTNPGTTQWRTVVFFSMGTVHPYVSALDVTDPDDPAPVWATDLTDVDYQGTSVAPSVDWVPKEVAGGSNPSWAMAMPSGHSDTPADVFLYLVDVPTGKGLRKIQLNTGSGSEGAKSLGVFGRAVMVDWDDDGVSDRVYVADANGRIWRHNLTNTTNPTNVCLVADVGQSIFHTPAFMVRQQQNGENVVAFYFGTADRPDSNDTPAPPYYFYGMVDEDQTNAQCTTASLLYKYELPSDEKLWADPTISADQVYFGTATGDKADLCDEDVSNPGHIYTVGLDPDGTNQAVVMASPVAAGGNLVSGLMVYDQHVVYNTVGGKTMLIGGSTWNNISGLVGAPGMKETYWNEVINK